MTSKVLAAVFGAVFFIALLSGCIMTSATVLDHTKSVEEGTETSATDDPRPAAESSEPPGGPAFVDNSTGAPAVKRDDELPADAKAIAVAGTFESSPAKYSDGILVTAEDLRSGVVTATGAGSISGAPYVHMNLKIQNGSPKDLGVGNVVVTLRYGSGKTAAAPLYDGVQQLDFAGVIKAGESQVRGYAFMVPPGTDEGTIFVDIDGAHTPAVLTGQVPE